MVKPSRVRPRMREVSLPTDMFSSDSEPEQDSGDEAYEAERKAFAAECFGSNGSDASDGDDDGDADEVEEVQSEESDC